MNKKAFTITEIVICLLVMGMIFGATITNTVRNDNYHKLYWSAFNTLFQATHNAQASFSDALTCSCANGEVCYTRECWNKEIDGIRTEVLLPGGSNHTREWPDFLYGSSDTNTYDGTGTDHVFCELLTSQINTLLSGNECTSFISSANPTMIDEVNNGGVEFKKAFATDSRNEIEPSFIAANGQRFYISSTVTANLMHQVAGNEAQRKTYRFVVVDLNGAAGPNSQFKTGGKFPDLVLFAITTKGDVIPLGLPEFYKTYINAIVQYPEFLNKRDPHDSTKFLRNLQRESDYMTLSDAKKHAWGPGIGQVDGVIYSQAYSADEPLSYSSLFYYNANMCKGGNNKCVSSGANDTYVDDLYSQIVMQFLYTEPFEKSGNAQVLPQLTTSTTPVPVAEEKGCTTGNSACKVVFMDK